MADSFYEKIYSDGMKHTPDVLACLANLSNDEVFTPPEVVNKMLDLLPKELFTDPNTTFLDPACKTGVFLREIAKRLLVGLEDKIPNLQERIDHIFHKQLYGIAITELTSLLSRRSLYCSKYPNGPYSITNFDNSEGNIRYRRINHNWDKNGKCCFCGVSKKTLLGNENRKSELESYAYEWIHKNRPEEIFKMKFDVIISNPPYQLNDGGGTGDSAKPIYNLFVEKSMSLFPNYIIMITPSRWMKGGKGLSNFRERMKNDTHIQTIVDYEDASECFPGVHIDGGVSYFLWNKNYNGEVNYTYYPKGQPAISSSRYLNNPNSDTIIRDYRQTSIIEKAAASKENFSSIVSYRNPYGYFADLFNNPNKYTKANLNFIEEEGKYKIYGVKGIKGGAKRVVGFVNISDDVLNNENFNKYKLFFSKAYMTTSTVPPEIILANPKEICTETFIQIGGFFTRSEAENCLSYIKTKFFRALLFYNRHSLNISKESFSLIPIVSFAKPWTDEELYAKYNLNAEEIEFIETMIKPMDGGDN